ncbi:MAG: RNA methyltransferase [Leptolyngbyaceae cyanobacterium bins.59]|nr:RNA methyltransferase [Leptolyngbyaceae cyanobacterium bins.59]
MKSNTAPSGAEDDDRSPLLKHPDPMSLAKIRIVLVEPAGPLNVGSVARVMKNMGLHHLVLVNPQCDPLSFEARQMAVHAGEVLESAVRVDSLPEALQGCQRAIATTGRPHTRSHPGNTPQCITLVAEGDRFLPVCAHLRARGSGAE